MGIENAVENNKQNDQNLDSGLHAVLQEAALPTLSESTQVGANVQQGSIDKATASLPSVDLVMETSHRHDHNWASEPGGTNYHPPVTPWSRVGDGRNGMPR